MFHPGAGGYEPYSYNQGGTDYHGETYDSYVTQNAPRASACAGTSLLKPGERFNAKVPPSYGGGSFFAYMEDVKDWETVTELYEKRRAPALKNALYGLANIPKPVSYTHLTLPTILRV